MLKNLILKFFKKPKCLPPSHPFSAFSFKEPKKETKLVFCKEFEVAANEFFGDKHDLQRRR